MVTAGTSTTPPGPTATSVTPSRHAEQRGRRIAENDARGFLILLYL
jgi:hypothetical protein